MLLRLGIRDFAVVEALELEFHRGFTALTGETGAGKSILIDALALALGERADSDQVRPGAERAEVTAEFGIDAGGALARWLADQALEGDAEGLLLRRVIDRGGRSRAFVNGRMATLAQLREAGERLVDIHGQHAHQSLLRAGEQRALLDAHAGLAARVAAVGAAYREWRRLAQARREHETHAAARAAEREQLAWQVGEIAALGLAAGEWEAIGNEHSRLANAAGLVEGVRSALEAVADSDASALAAVSGALSRLRALSAFDSSLGEIVALLDSSEIQLIEAVHALRRYGERLELDPQREREVEDRLQAIHAVARKLRVQPEALPGLLAERQARLNELDEASDLPRLIENEREAEAAYRDRARALSAERRKAAARMGREVSAAMKELAMTGARFEVALRALEAGSAAGDEDVEFLVSASAGIEPRSLARIASGGELSRISLAIQVVASRAASVPTLIFDEVDAGIGGAVAEVVGRKLAALGSERQVLCVTHLPQVAARAAEQWSVRKETRNGRAASSVTVLDRGARVDEIARMLGGVEITPTTRRHAVEMLGEG